MEIFLAKYDVVDAIPPPSTLQIQGMVIIFPNNAVQSQKTVTAYFTRKQLQNRPIHLMLKGRNFII